MGKTHAERSNPTRIAYVFGSKLLKIEGSRQKKKEKKSKHMTKFTLRFVVQTGTMTIVVVGLDAGSFHVFVWSFKLDW